MITISYWGISWAFLALSVVFGTLGLAQHVNEAAVAAEFKKRNAAAVKFQRANWDAWYRGGEKLRVAPKMSGTAFHYYVWRDDDWRLDSSEKLVPRGDGTGNWVQDVPPKEAPSAF